MLNGIDPVLYEIVNLVIAALSMFVVTIFVRYLIAERTAGRFALLAWRPFNGMLRHQMAIAIIVASSGEAGMRGWTWLVRVLDRMGYDVRWMRYFPYVLTPIIAAVIQSVGLLCFIRVVTPDEWGRRTWLVCLVIVAFLVLATGALRL